MCLLHRVESNNTYLAAIIHPLVFILQIVKLPIVITACCVHHWGITNVIVLTASDPSRNYIATSLFYWLYLVNSQCLCMDWLHLKFVLERLLFHHLLLFVYLSTAYIHLFTYGLYLSIYLRPIFMHKNSYFTLFHWLDETCVLWNISIHHLCRSLIKFYFSTSRF